MLGIMNVIRQYEERTIVSEVSFFLGNPVYDHLRQIQPFAKVAGETVCTKRKSEEGG